MRSRMLTSGSRKTSVFVVATLLIAIAACAGSAPPRTTAAPVPCEGNEVAVVRNETGELVDVFVFSGKAQLLLGTARLGRNEFGLPPQPAGQRHAFNAKTASGATVRLSRPSQSPASRLMIAVECRGNAIRAE